MPERGADPNVPRIQRKVLDAVRALTSPLLPDDYLEMINPLWSTRELRGRIESIDAETPDAATVLIKPGYRWDGHQPGQYLRIGLDIEGVRHWRAYSLTSDPQREDGCISITVKNVDEGKVSPFLVRRGGPGTIVGLGGVEGEFVLPDELPEKLLFISAGSGITPIMSMLRSLAHRDELNDAVLIHSARDEDDVIFGEQLEQIEREHEGFRVHRQYTGEVGRMTPSDLDELCSDWKERETYLSGPAEMLDAMDEHWDTPGRRRPAPRGALPAEDRRRHRGGQGRHDRLPRERLQDRVRRRHADPGGRRGGGAHAPLRLQGGHLPHLRRQARVGPGPRPA